MHGLAEPVAGANRPATAATASLAVASIAEVLPLSVVADGRTALLGREWVVAAPRDRTGAISTSDEI